MSQAIVLDAEFQSFAAFQTAFDAYCQQNTVSNVPLAFVRQNSKKLAANTFSNELPLDRQIIDRFIYQRFSMVCTHHRSNSTRKDGLFCEGRITLRFIREQNVLRVSSFVGEHLNHRTAVDNSRIDNNPLAARTEQLNRIIALVRQMPDDEALDFVEDTCKNILEKWNSDNHGLEVHLIEKQNPASPIIKTEPQLPSIGKFLY